MFCISISLWVALFLIAVYFSTKGEWPSISIQQADGSLRGISSKRNVAVGVMQSNIYVFDNDSAEDKVITRQELMRVLKKMHNRENIERDYFAYILRRSKKLLQSSDLVYDIKLPNQSSNTQVTVIGDTHGQYDTILYIFQMNGFPSEEHVYIINGDFMDKGSQSIESLIALYLYKLHCPSCIHFTRGNHETDEYFRFMVKRQVLERYDEEVYGLILETIYELPIALTIENKVFVIHAGITSSQLTLEDLKSIKRGIEPEEDTLNMDIIWADPGDEDGMGGDSIRGLLFGPDVSEEFLANNHLKIIVRAHDSTVDSGYQNDHDGRVLTIFSSPLCTKGSFLNINSLLEFEVVEFSALPKIKEWLEDS